MPFVTVSDGTHIYYETLGAGEPLLLVAGQADDHHTWDPVRDAFAAHYQVIVFDHRGTGQSDKPEQPPYSTRGFAQDARDVLDALGVKKAHTYGYSMGGRVLQWFGIDYPDRTATLVLACTTPGNKHGIARSAAAQAVLASAGTPEGAKAFLGLKFTQKWMADHADLLAEMDRLKAEYPVPDYARKLHLQASDAHDTFDLLSSIKAPTLVIHGSDDEVNPTPNAQLLAEHIPNTELYIVQGGRHFFFIEFAQEANRVILDFLGRHPITA